MDQFLRGAVAAGCLVIGLFFLRFFKRDRDPLFLYFALSFFLMGAARVALGVAASNDLSTSIPYWARAFAYLLVVIAIINKNIFKGATPGASPQSGNP